MSGMVLLQHPWIDSSRAPLYVLTFPSSTTDAELSACCVAREVWAEQVRYPVAWVVDLSAIRAVTARQRRIFGEHLGRVERHNITYNQGAALIVPSTVLRGVVTATFWIKAPRFTYQLFATRKEGLEWAQERLRHSHASHAPPRDI